MNAPEDPNGLREALDAFEEAVRDEVRWAPHDTGQYPNHRVALRKERRQELDDLVASLIADRASLRAAEAEITRLKEGVEALGAALEPFATFAEDMVDDEGWCSLEYRASISTWFGPSQFRNARQALATLSPKEPTHG